MNWLKTAISTIALCTIGLAFAAEPEDFAGTWVLNTKLGENLGMMSAVQETMVITLDDARLVMDYTDSFAGKTTTRQVTYALDGAVVDNFAAMGDPSKTASTWDGSQLVTTWTSEGSIAGTEVERTETRWLSDDGKQLSSSMVRGDNPAMVFVYEKQE